jgi:small subunit ribosomal protein S5
MRKIDPNTLELEERVVKTNKCQKTHKGGRTLSWNALVVVGDGHGHVGAAIGKARGIPDAIRKGFEAAKKELISVPLAGQTIPHQIQSHHGASVVLLKPASPGTGVVAGGSMRHILEAAGVKDVVAKSLGSANAINTAWATLRALSELRSPTEVARLRGVETEQLTYRPPGGSEGANGNGRGEVAVAPEARRRGSGARGAAPAAAAVAEAERPGPEVTPAGGSVAEPEAAPPAEPELAPDEGTTAEGAEDAQ